MNIIPTDIPDVLVFEPKVYGDERGYFLETWRASWFAQAGIDHTFVQDNQSSSRQGVLRGLHYQIKHPQGKLVRVISGRVFDVGVDLRRGSPTFGRWVGAELSSENHRLFWVPPGFAHGYYVLSEKAEFVYKCTDYYAPEHEKVLRYDDPDLMVEWPVLSGIKTILSAKDAAGVPFGEAELFE
jgi:dTDP-4-dehydrorhamnose 3,5-epimerase